MITDFKIFESEIKIKTHWCWTIYGDKETIINVLTYLNRLKINRLRFKFVFSSINDEDEPFMIGIVLFSEKDKESGYATFQSIEEKNDIIETYTEKYDQLSPGDDHKYKFKGELRVENDKLILDTSELDIKKYNL